MTLLLCSGMAVLVWGSACQPDFLVHQTHTFPEQGWTYADTATFEAYIDDTTTIYNLYLEVEHSTVFPYQNIYIRIHTSFPQGQQLQEQLSLELADKTQWFGHCHSETCTLRIPIQEGAFFNQAGTYTFSVEQFMRVNPLPDIQRLTFLLQKTEQKR